jgi:hypothetical protein
MYLKQMTTSWTGTVQSIQPRIRLSRSFDQASHSYLGYVLKLEGTVSNEHRTFSVAIGPAQQKKFHIEAGDTLSGLAEPVPDPRMETAEFFRVSKLKVEKTPLLHAQEPPWLGPPPALEIYRQRGQRRLAATTFEKSCSACIWGCRMPVEMIIDHWNPAKRKYRFETFCYGPKNCSIYSAGAKRIVPGRNGMKYIEEDWVDEQSTSHRSDEE